MRRVQGGIVSFTVHFAGSIAVARGRCRVGLPVTADLLPCKHSRLAGTLWLEHHTRVLDRLGEWTGRRRTVPLEVPSA